jgi:hypothetical protein
MHSIRHDRALWLRCLGHASTVARPHRLLKRRSTRQIRIPDQRAISVSRAAGRTRSEGRDRGGLELAATVHGWAPAGLLDTYEGI